MSERLGLFGGTFDPPHVGHLVTAVNVRHELALDRVLLVVNDQPWQKLGTREITPAEDRFAMVEAAVGSVDGLEASRIEIDRGGLSFTADTLHGLEAEDAVRELFVILGSDAAVGLPSWERADEVRELATVVVVERPGARERRTAAGLALAERRGAPARGVEHRPASPCRRGATVGLPVDPRGDRGRASTQPLPIAGRAMSTDAVPGETVPDRGAPAIRASRAIRAAGDSGRPPSATSPSTPPSEPTSPVPHPTKPRGQPHRRRHRSPPPQAPRRPRPTSRRGRVVARRLTAGLPALRPRRVVDVSDAADEARRAATRRTSTAVRRRRHRVLAGMGVLTVAGVALAVGGLSAVRNSTAGRYQQAIGPAEPGYQASVVPTPTLGVLRPRGRRPPRRSGGPGPRAR